MLYREKYNIWLESAIIDEKIKEELRSLKDEGEIEDRFYKDLEFGTGGLRGIIGAGSNRMNIYTVSKATQGFANYLNQRFENPSVAIAYDSRNMSDEFSKAAALTLCANNIKVYLYESLRPTPMLSFAARYLNCSGGIVVTASHNPKEYNGYKVYDEFGGQVTDEKANIIISEVNNINSFEEIKTIKEEEALREGLLVYIGEDVDKAYIDLAKSLTVRKKLVKENANNLKVIYTPIHGSGNMPVGRVLNELGYTNVSVVKEQEKPDGNFPTASYPNPEEPAVFKLALEMAKFENPDVIFATDPDADRIGVVVKDSEGEYKVLTGNQTGLLLTEYIVGALKEENKLPENGAIIKTIVTTDGTKEIAKAYNVELIEVLTGFKYIAEKVQGFEVNKDKAYLFGFEESYGYLAGDFVRDKDAVTAAMLISEMTLFYKQKGKSLYDALIDLYERYGYFKETLVSFELKGKEGSEKISKCIDSLRNEDLVEINGMRIATKYDYSLSIEENKINGEKKEINLPKSNVLKFVLENGSWFVVRPSGTEPKMKAYVAVKGDSLNDSEKQLESFKNEVVNLINKKLN